MGIDWSLSEISRLRELNGSGVPDYLIAEHLGRARSSVSCKRRDLGLPPTLRLRWSWADIAEAKTLRASGLTYRKIAVKMGRSCEAVTSLFRDLHRSKRRGVDHVIPIGPRHHRAERGAAALVKLTPEQIASEQLRVATITAIARYATGKRMHIDQAAALLLSGRLAA
jgi:hypothetical protein